MFQRFQTLKQIFFWVLFGVVACRCICTQCDITLTVAGRSMWNILAKGISECKACGRKKPTTSATRARLSWKGIVTHSGGGSSSWLFIVSVMSRLFCKFDTCSASLWTTKLFPTPGWSEVTTWTFKLKKSNAFQLLFQINNFVQLQFSLGKKQ